MGAKSDQPTRGKMGRIDQLPTEIKDLVNRRLREGASQAEIIKQTTPLLAALGLPPLSRSGVNRYTSRIERAGRRIREAREAAAAWAATSDEGAGDVGKHTVEVLRTLALDMTLQAASASDDAEAPPLSPSQMKDLALTIQRLEAAGEHAAKRERELRSQLAAEAETEIKRAGISADTAAAIRAALDEV